MSNWLLKIHLFLFYSSVACTIVYLTVYYKRYSDCSYHEIGLLVMFVALGGAILKPLICSYADRHGNYKRCLILTVGINGLSTLGLAMVPFYPQLLFDEPHPRLMWYLVALDSFIGHICLSLGVTLSDVFVIQECLQSRIGEHFGQYRIIGAFGWAVSSISVAIAEPYIQLPYLSLPLLASSLFLSIDAVLLTQVNEIHSRSKKKIDISYISGAINEQKGRVSNQATTMAKVRPPIPRRPAIVLKDPVTGRDGGTSGGSTNKVAIYATVEPDRLRGTRRAASSASSPTQILSTCEHNLGYHVSNHRPKLDLFGTRGSDDQRISFKTQLNLLVRLSRHDEHHLVKYLVLFVVIGAFEQIHYIFYFQYFTEILDARDLITMVFTLSALIQITNCFGETLGLLWVGRFLIHNFGRDISLLLAVMISGLRVGLIGYFIEQMSIWSIAMLEVSTGLLYGISYTTMIESASSYLSLLDRLLLVETDDSSHNEANLEAKLEELKEIYSIEAIRFAIRATVQGVFSGACEGVGFAIGPLLAGIWLSLRNDSMESLYRDLAYAHLGALFAIVSLEFGLMRLMLGSRSKVDRLALAGNGCS